MNLQADRVEVSGAHAPLLPATSLSARTGEVTLVAGDPGYGQVALALALAGRLVPSSGGIRLDGVADRSALRTHVALVDVPSVTEPEEGLTVRAVIAEELAFSRQRARGADVTRYLQAHGADSHGVLRWEQLPGGIRTAWLADLAARRAAVDFLVLASPDRFGGDPCHWWDVARALAQTGKGVIVQCTHASARLLSVPVAYELGVS
jgi:ABC-type cobalamin/Fe3+-siderophores transport system ATPase subunit